MSLYTGALERAAAGAASVSAGLFASLSRMRGKRFFHPEGETYEGTASFLTTSFDLPFAGVGQAVVRLSRGAGLPGSLPDVFGLAVAFPEYGHDLLLASSGAGVLTRHLLVPGRSFFSLPYSSVLPYELDGRLVVFGARAGDGVRGLDPTETAEMGPLVATGRLRFDLTVAAAGSGGIERFASLVIDRSHEGDVRFNPWNCAPPLRPAGPLNRLRLETYAASQRARPT